MQADKTTLQDLSIFHAEEEQSVLKHLDFTTTVGGRDVLRQLLARPFKELKKIKETQQTLQLMLQKLNEWPHTITNGTLMVVGKFYDSPIDEMPDKANSVNGFFYRIMNTHDYSLVKFSVTHFIDFAKGLHQIINFFPKENNPPLLQMMLDRISMLLNKPFIHGMINWNKSRKLSTVNILEFG